MICPTRGSGTGDRTGEAGHERSHLPFPDPRLRTGGLARRSGIRGRPAGLGNGYLLCDPMPRVVDEEFRHPRLAAIYDALDPDRGDLVAYVALTSELGARRVLDVGCGTGTFALMLAELGCDVIAVDPAAASVAVARGKSGSDRVRWTEGDATSVEVSDRDLITLTANAAQAIADPADWTATLSACRRALRPGGHLVFETRHPQARAWEGWTREASHCTTDVRGVGAVTRWVEVVGVDGPSVTFRWTFVFAVDDATLTSTSTLRFRTQSEVEDDLSHAGLVEVRLQHQLESTRREAWPATTRRPRVRRVR